MATERFDIIITAKGTARTARQIQRIGKEADLSRRALSQMRAALVVFSAARALGGIVNTADALTNLRNRLQSTLGSFGAAVKAQEALIIIARQTRTDLDTTADSFARLALGAADLGISAERLLGITKTLNQAIILSGSSAQEARNAMVQLSQGIASGTLRGDELRSVLEQLPLVARLIAKELGITIGKLREFGAEGKISSEIVLAALEGNAKAIEEAFGGTVETIGQALSQLNTEFTVFLDKMNETAGLSDIFIGTIKGLGDAMNFFSENTVLVNVSLGALATGGVLFLLNALKKLAIIGTVTTALAAARTAMLALTVTAGITSGALAGIAAFLSALFAPITLIIGGLIALGAGLFALNAKIDENEKRFEAGKKAADRFAATLSGDLLKSAEAGEDALEALEKSIVSIQTLAKEQTGGGVGGFFSRLLGLTPELTGEMRVELDRQIALAFEAREKIGNRFQEEIVVAFGIDEGDDSFTAIAEKTLARVERKIEVLKGSSKANRAVLKALQTADIKDADSAAGAKLTSRVQALEGLKKAIKDREKAVRAAAAADKKATADSKSLIEANETRRESIARVTLETEKLRKKLTELTGSEQRAAEIIGRARQANIDMLDQESRKRIEAFTGKTKQATLDQALTNITLKQTQAFKMLTDEEQKRIGGTNALRKSIEKLTNAEKTRRAQAANDLIIEASLQQRILANQEKINKAFKDAEGTGKLKGGVTKDEISRRQIRNDLGLGNQAEDTRRQIEALTKAQREFGLSTEDVNRKIRDLNISLLEQQTTVGAGFDRFFLKYQRDVADSAKATEQLLGKAIDGLTDSMVEFATTGKLSFTEFTNSILRDMTRLAAKGLIADIASIASGKGNTQSSFFGDLFGGAGRNKGGGGFSGFNTRDNGAGSDNTKAVGGIIKLIGSFFGGGNSLGDFGDAGGQGFAKGGSFTVGANTSLANTAGVDNRLVGFRARDGERVTITPKGASFGERPVNVSFVINTPDSNSFRKSQQQILNDTQIALRRASGRNA